MLHLNCVSPIQEYHKQARERSDMASALLGAHRARSDPGWTHHPRHQMMQKSASSGSAQVWLPYVILLPRAKCNCRLS